MKLHWMEKASLVPVAIWLLMVSLEIRLFMGDSLLVALAFGFLLLRGQHIRHSEQRRRWFR